MILVIGGAGLIGSHLVRALEPPITVLDDLSRGHATNLPNHVHLVGGSVTEADTVIPLVSRASLVVYLAAVPVWGCEADPAYAVAVHVHALGLVAAACALQGTRLVYASTGSVYGAAPDRPSREDDARLGRGVYAETKITAEHLLDRLQPEFVGLRFQSVYGIARQTGYQAVIPKFLTQAWQGTALTVYGDGSQRYDFVHVDDAVRALQCAMIRGRGFVNVATGVGTSIRELAEKITARLGGQIRFTDGPTAVPTMLGDPTWARESLGFEAAVSLDAGLDRLCCKEAVPA